MKGEQCICLIVVTIFYSCTNVLALYMRIESLSSLWYVVYSSSRYSLVF